MSKKIDLRDLTWEDILKMGGPAGTELLRSLIGRELNDHDHRIRALTSIRIKEYKNTKIEDMLKFLQYKKES